MRWIGGGVNSCSLPGFNFKFVSSFVVLVYHVYIMYTNFTDLSTLPLSYLLQTHFRMCTVYTRTCIDSWLMSRRRMCACHTEVSGQGSRCPDLPFGTQVTLPGYTPEIYPYKMVTLLPSPGNMLFREMTLNKHSDMFSGHI
jgi:hypothetical protein